MAQQVDHGVVERSDVQVIGGQGEVERGKRHEVLQVRRPVRDRWWWLWGKACESFRVVSCISRVMSTTNPIDAAPPLLAAPPGRPTDGSTMSGGVLPEGVVPAGLVTGGDVPRPHTRAGMAPPGTNVDLTGSISPPLERGATPHDQRDRYGQLPRPARIHQGRRP